jgi:hypothetical protein
VRPAWDGSCGSPKGRVNAPFYFLPLAGVLVLGAAPLALLEDAIFLKKRPEKEIMAKVTDLKPDHVTAIVSKEDVTSVSYSMEEKEGYFDKVTFGSGEVNCKILDMGESTMVLELPRDEVASVRVFFQKEQGVASSPKTETPARTPSDLPNLGSPSSLQQLKEELKRELMEEMTAEKKQEEKAIVAETTGRVEGKITRGGNPLPGCKVKIIMMVEKKGSLSAFLRSHRVQSDAPEYEAETDREGRYVFENVPVGDYKIYWRPPGEVSWIRRMKMEPDVFVQAGKTFNPKVIDTGRATIN